MFVHSVSWECFTAPLPPPALQGRTNFSWWELSSILSCFCQRCLRSCARFLFLFCLFPQNTIYRLFTGAHHWVSAFQLKCFLNIHLAQIFLKLSENTSSAYFIFGKQWRRSMLSLPLILLDSIRRNRQPENRRAEPRQKRRSTRCWGKLWHMENFSPIPWTAFYVESCSAPSC